MSEFVKHLDELLHIAGKRAHLTKHLEKNYKENIHYIKQNTPKKQCHGGQNKIIFLLTEVAFELLKNSDIIQIHLHLIYQIYYERLIELL